MVDSGSVLCILSLGMEFLFHSWSFPLPSRHAAYESDSLGYDDGFSNDNDKVK